MCPISRLITAGDVAVLPGLSIGQVSSVKDGWLLIFYFLYFFTIFQKYMPNKIFAKLYRCFHFKWQW
jgi:hypothetical protein